MSSAASLSSVATALTELTARVSAIADDLLEANRDDLAGVLYEVERSLGTASRRLDQVLDDLR